MKLLMLGGTRFLGKTIVETALRRGHEVTLFNRGNRPELFPQLEQLAGDRDGGLDALLGREWDAVIDTSGYVPRVVKQSLEALSTKVRHYTFISTIDVYDEKVPGVISENHPVKKLEDESMEDVQTAYGPMKARCEELVMEQMDGEALIVRCGLIAGPGDHSDRLTYWPSRVARGGEVLAPGNPQAPVQFIDVRDLSEWIVCKIEERCKGIFTATGPSEPLTMGRFLQACARTVADDASFTWVTDDFLKEHEVGAWIEMPLWIPESENLHSLMSIDVSKAINAGLAYRPLEETIKDTLRWDNERQERTERKAGLAAEKEQRLLELWNKRWAEEGAS
ncbi:NAD-dependent epimerase/dehydratase family protein [Paenibacillus soyae]|uniref:NAD-dependent epimerase/dehydratase family protein n=1 Tax=Paenibacillus soyae TaxID=2969249 RepID=A0A9X2MS51_9BACL|nr:NAD-dependent epimerase/dehydratase family protein [Paenibacillus soyae]MCR2805345.1 NAD-dependent epimerase/dehydratase family protein [Paenibacillus soyae]